MTADQALRIGVVLEAFGDWPLEQVMPWLREHAPDVTDLEIGAGGYAPHPHCDVQALLASSQARSAWQAEIARHGLRIDALNANGKSRSLPTGPAWLISPRRRARSCESAWNCTRARACST